MKNIIFVFLLVFLSVGLVFAGEFRNIQEEGRVEIAAQLGKMMEIVVLNGIADIIRSGDPESIKVEHVGGRLFIAPLSKVPTELVVLDRSGKTYRLAFVFDSGYDEKIVLGKKGKKIADRSGSGGIFNLMKALVRGSKVALAVERPFNSVLTEGKHYRLVAEKIYELPGLLGYRAKFENNGPNSMVLPLQEIRYPGLLAISSQDDIVRSGSETFVYMVIKR